MPGLLALVLLLPSLSPAASDCDGVPLSTDAFIVAETRLSGRDARLALDPIANVLLDRAFAEASGFEILDAGQVGYEGQVLIGGAGARQQEPGFVLGLELAAPALEGMLPPVVVVDLRTPLGASFEGIDGLLGTDLFDRHVLDIDLPAGCLHLLERGSFEAPDERPLKVERRRGRPVVTGAIEFAHGLRHEMSFLLDFGMSGAVRVATRFVDEHGLADRLETRVPDTMETGLGGELESLETQAARLELGAAAWKDLPVRLARETVGADADPPWDALIGVGLLEDRRLIYDPAGDRIWML